MRNPNFMSKIDKIESQEGNVRKNLPKKNQETYFFSFLIIARSHAFRFIRNLVEMNPTDLPDLFKTSRTYKNLRKTPKMRKNLAKISRKNNENPYIILLNAFKSLLKGIINQ